MLTIVRHDAAILSSLVGVPYVPRGRTREGADCWGIVLLAARELFYLDLPEFFYSSEELALLEDAQALIGHETRAACWREVQAPFAAGAVHIFRIHGQETHCGLHLGADTFLHSL